MGPGQSHSSESVALLGGHIEYKVAFQVIDLKAHPGKDVLVHCVYGSGRSACVMAALLVAGGHCATCVQAYKLMQTKRKIVSSNKIFTR